MRILVGQNHLNTLGGSETYTYALVKELSRKSHKVDLITGNGQGGLLYNKIMKEFECNPFDADNVYDYAIVNHTSTIKRILSEGIKSEKLIQVCHGTTPALEQPYGYPVENYISVSHEVGEHLLDLGFNSGVIYNGIDTERFSYTKSNKQLKNVLSLCQSSNFNDFLSEACKTRGLNFMSLNKFKNPVFNVEQYIKESDLVITLGRGAYESMSCGKNVLVADHRPYQASMMDGLITPDNIDKIILKNCSGRTNQRPVTIENLMSELDRYDINNCEHNRNYVLENLNVCTQTDKILQI